MVLGLALMGAMAPAMINMDQGSKDPEARRQHAKRQRGHLLTECYTNEETAEQRDQVHNGRVYLDEDGKLYVTKHATPTMTPFDGHFYTHPDFPPDNKSGLITLSGETPPLARWVFLDAETNEMRFGGKGDTQGHICGPFDLLDVESGYVTLERRQRWLAVKLPEQQAREKEALELGIAGSEGGVGGSWTLYFDRDEYVLPEGTQWVKLRLMHVPAGR
ncbi:hypothetical protein Asppvi_006296 [Aspergillus pseudoviridinutans]|uniref:Uncharacterized protein n=1 Tax=Aspergillus pseudoviridinutans TaxID=1517512 RepID=A0A9P3BDN3_9EURO|nr:uncharacterized protein Asppvi_006296 [Aspergillus pseudoviridinutans]GIJ87390.1 hypothetical protein Asppvi_006296 [Aspergillus pseudoviridinutans]